MATSTSPIRAAIDAGAAQARAELEDLCRIPGIAFEGFDPESVQQSAEATAALLERSGLQGVRVLTDGGAAPAVYGESVDAGPDRPTVLLYAHHDVQPTGDPAAWTSPPFEPTERRGRLFGRGCADDKAGVIAHASAVAAWVETAGAPPVNVKVFIEGEEEVGSPNLAGFLAASGDLLQSDVAVIADLVNWQVGVPSLTYILRGMVDVHVSVDILDHAVHSGMYGGPVPDPLTVLAKLVAGLTDDRGVVTLPQLREGLRPPTATERAALQNLDFDAERFRVEAGLRDGIPFGGDDDIPVLQRVWMEPFLSILGIDAPSVAGASNSIQASASAKLGMRLGPGQDAARIRDALVGHLNAQTPQGVRITATGGAAGDPFQTNVNTPAARTMIDALHEGYGTEPVLMGCGGSIPLVGPLQAANPDATMLLVGVEDPDSRAHGIDESLHLGDWESARASIALLLGKLGAV